MAFALHVPSLRLKNVVDATAYPFSDAKVAMFDALGAGRGRVADCLRSTLPLFGGPAGLLEQNHGVALSGRVQAANHAAAAVSAVK